MSSIDDNGGLRRLDGSSERVSLPSVLVMIACGLLLPVLAWLHRPLSMRNYGDAAMVALQGTWVLKVVFFYGSCVASAGFLVAAGVRLWRR